MTPWEKIKQTLKAEVQMTPDELFRRTANVDEETFLSTLAEAIERGFVVLDTTNEKLSLANDPKPAGRGGWRPGSGRKPGPPNQRKIVLSVRLSPQIAAWLRSQKNMGQIIEAALRAQYGQIGEINA